MHRPRKQGSRSRQMQIDGRIEGELDRKKER